MNSHHLPQELPVCSDLTTLFLQARPLIDLRAPIEFAAGAFPNAINLPLMSDEERAARLSGWDRAVQAVLRY